MSKHFTYYCPMVAGNLLLILCFGCETAEYEEQLGRTIARLEQQSEFTTEMYPPKQVPGTPAWVQLPRSFEEAPLADDGGDDGRRRPPVYVGGLKSTYEGFIVDGSGGKMPFYCYLSALDAASPPAARFNRSMRTQLLSGLDSSIGPWETVQCRAPTGGASEWQKLRATGAQQFYYVDGNGQGGPREMDGVMEFYTRQDSGFLIVIGWRMPAAIEQYVGLSEWAPRVAGSVTFKAM